MAVEWFLIDAPHLVPSEFRAWTEAKERHYAIFRQAVDAQASGKPDEALEAAGVAAKVEADRLERIAWDAWQRALDRKAA